MESRDGMTGLCNKEEADDEVGVVFLEDVSDGTLEVDGVTCLDVDATDWCC